jgi:lipopolysaccharide transport system ATP-binding protein
MTINVQDEGSKELADSNLLEGDIGSMTSELAKITEVAVYNDKNERVETIISEEKITIQIAVKFYQPFEDPHVGFKIRDRMGRVIFETNTYCMNESIGQVIRGQSVCVKFAFKASLLSGEYTLTIGVADSGYLWGSFKQQLAYVHDLAPFTVLQNQESIRWAGIYNVEPKLAILRS